VGGELQPIKRKITVITKYFLNLLLVRLYLNIMLAIYVVSAKVQCLVHCTKSYEAAAM
jgi:hypothetical protein